MAPASWEGTWGGGPRSRRLVSPPGFWSGVRDWADCALRSRDAERAARPRRARAAVLLGGGGGVGDGASDAGARALLSRCARRPGVEGTEALRSRVSRGGCPRIQEEGRASTRVGAQAGVRGPRDAETQASVWVRARGRELGVGEDCSKLQGVSAPGCRGLGAARAALRGCSGVAGLLRQAGGWPGADVRWAAARGAGAAPRLGAVCPEAPCRDLGTSGT